MDDKLKILLCEDDENLGMLLREYLAAKGYEAELCADGEAGFKAFLISVHFSSVAQSCPTLCDPMNRSTPALPVHYQFPEFTQAHVHRVGDAIQPSHPLSSPSPLAPNPSQHQSFPMSQLFTSGGQSIGLSALASVLPVNTQD